MRIILSSNPYRDRGLRTALEADRILRKAGAETVLCLPFVPKKGERLELPRQAALHKLEEELPKADLLVCFGGDGTILHAARDATLHGVPILGVNMGSVGFMAELERTELSLLVPLAKGHFVTEERMMLDIRLFRGEKQLSQDLALNDGVFSKGSMARVAEVEVLADQVLVQRIMGDGVIVATPTGSTAYSLSAGGPILDAHVRGIVVTPICAHSLHSPSIVFAADRRITIRVDSAARDHALLSSDGEQERALQQGGAVQVELLDRCVKLITFNPADQFDAIDKKLRGR